MSEYDFSRAIASKSIRLTIVMDCRSFRQRDITLLRDDASLYVQVKFRLVKVAFCISLCGFLFDELFHLIHYLVYASFAIYDF